MPGSRSTRRSSSSRESSSSQPYYYHHYHSRDNDSSKENSSSGNRNPDPELLKAYEHCINNSNAYSNKMSSDYCQIVIANMKNYSSGNDNKSGSYSSSYSSGIYSSGRYGSSYSSSCGYSGF